MEKRINIQQVEPQGYKSMFPLERYITTTRLTTTHKNLIKIIMALITINAWNRISISPQLQPED